MSMDIGMWLLGILTTISIGLGSWALWTTHQLTVAVAVLQRGEADTRAIGERLAALEDRITRKLDNMDERVQKLAVAMERVNRLPPNADGVPGGVE